MADDYATAVRMYDLYLAAEESILTGQSVSMGGRTLTRADLGAVARERKSWGEKKNALSGAGRKITVLGATPA